MSHVKLSAHLKEGCFYLLMALLLPGLYWGVRMLAEQFSDVPRFIGIENYLHLFLEDSVLRQALVNTFVWPLCFLSPAAVLSMWGAKRLGSAPGRRQLWAGGIALGIAVLSVAAGAVICWIWWGKTLSILSYILIGLGGGLLFLPARLAGNRLGRQHGIFRPLFQLVAAYIAAELFYLLQVLQNIRINLLYSEWGAAVPSTSGALRFMLYLAVLICLLLWCFSSFYRLFFRIKAQVQ